MVSRPDSRRKREIYVYICTRLPPAFYCARDSHFPPLSPVFHECNRATPANFRTCRPSAIPAYPPLRSAEPLKARRFRYREETMREISSGLKDAGAAVCAWPRDVKAHKPHQLFIISAQTLDFPQTPARSLVRRDISEIRCASAHSCGLIARFALSRAFCGE